MTQAITTDKDLKAIIHFEDWGQDFLWFKMDHDGKVIDAGPLQGSIWGGIEILNFRSLIERGFVAYYRPDQQHESYTLKYPIREIEWQGSPLFSPVTAKQIRMFKAYLSKEPKAQATAPISIRNWTIGRTHHISDVSSQEFQNIYRDVRTETENSKDKQRKRVISHLAEAGYTLPNGKPDMESIYAWVRKQKFKKELNNHTSAELSKLIHAAAQVKKHLLSK